MAIDNIGRDVGGGMNSQELRGTVASLAKGNVGKAVPFNKTAGSEPSQSAMPPEMSKKFDNMVKLLKDFVKNFKGKSGDKPTLKNPTSIKSEKMMLKMAEHGLKKGSIYTHDVYLEKIARLNWLETKALRIAMTSGTGLADLELEIKNLVGELEKYENKRDSSPEAAEAERLEATEKRMKEIRDSFIPLRLMQDLGNSAADLQQTLFGFRGTDTVFKDLFAEERKFTIDARQAAFEVAGITKESRGLQRAFEDIGKAASETGFDRTTYSKAYLSNYRKGLKDKKLSEAITKKQLNTEKMIGVEAGALGDTFLNMSLQMKMSNNEMSEFGRGIQEVARNTGVTGENLADAVRSSEDIIKNMRNAGSLNAEAASNVVGLMASFKKFGVSEAGQEITATLSKGMAGFMQADAGMKLILSRAAGGDMTKIYDATLMNTKKGIKQMATGMGDLLAEFSGGMVRTREDFEKLSDYEKQELNTRLQLSPIKKSAGEVLGLIDSYNEQGASLGDKLTKINKDREKTLTLEEKANLLEQERSLKTNTALEALTKLDAASKGAKNMGEAFSNLKMGELADDLNAMGIKTTDSKVAMKEAMKASVAGINENLKKAGKKQLQISEKDIGKALNDPEAYREMVSQINKANAEAGVGQKTQLDVTTELNQSMITLNETLRGTTQGAISSMLSSVFGRSLGILTTLADVGGRFAGFAYGAVVDYGAFQNSLETLGGNFRTFMNSSVGQSITSFASSMNVSLASIGVAAAVVAGTVGGLIQSVRSGEKAAEIFGKSMEEVTTAEFYAAKGAGFVTGFLNTITFGIFDHWLGAAGSITKALAHFNRVIPLLSIVMGIIDVIGGAIWGVVTTISDTIMGIGEMIYYIFEPFGSLFSAIGDVVFAILDPFFDFKSSLSETGSLFKMTADIVGSLGKVIRFVLRTVGRLIGGLISVVIEPLAYAIRVVGTAFSIVSYLISPFIEMFYNFGMGIAEVLQGIATFDIFKIGQGLYRSFITSFTGIFTGIFNGIITWANNLANSILAPFRWLYDILVGHSIVPDLVTKIIFFFAKLPFGIMKGIGSIVSLISGTMKTGFSEIAGYSKSLFSGFVKGFSGAKNSQQGFFKSVLAGFGGMKNSGAGKSILGAGSSALSAGAGVLGKGKGLLGKGKRLLSSVAGAGKSMLGSFFGGGGGEAAESGSGCCCSGLTEAISDSPLGAAAEIAGKSDGLMGRLFGKAKARAAGVMEKGKGLMGNLWGKASKNPAVSKAGGLLGSMFGKAGGVATKAGGLLSKGGGLLGSLFGKAGGVAAKAGGLFSKSGGLMGSMFGKAGGFIAKAGLGGVGKSLLKKLPGIGALAGAGFALSALVQGNVGGAVKELASGLAGAIPFIGPVLSAGIDFFGDGLISGAGKLAGSAWEGAKSIASSAWDGAKNLGSTLWEGTKNLGSKLWDGAKTIGEGALWLGQKYIDGWKAVGKTVGEGALWLGQKYIDGWKTVGKGALWAGQKVLDGASWLGSKAGTLLNDSLSAASATKSTSAQTATSASMHERVQRDQVTKEPSVSSVGGPELGTIAGSSQTQVEKLTEMVGLLTDMVALMQPSSSSGGGGQAGGSTLTNSVVTSPPRYYKWSTGSFNQTASKGITNIANV